MEIRIIRSLYDLKVNALLDLYFEQEPRTESAIQKENEFYAFLREDFFLIPEAFYCVMEDHGVYLSALRMEPYEDGWLLSGLQTRTGDRGKGYASACLEHSLFFLNGLNKVYSHVAKNNASSMKVHEKLGFHPLKDYAVFQDGSVDRNAFTLVLDLKNQEIR